MEPIDHQYSDSWKSAHVDNLLVKPDPAVLDAEDPDVADGTPEVAVRK